MTNREFLTAVANLANTYEWVKTEENIPEELKAQANIFEELKNEAIARIEKLDASNEARKNKPSKKATENAPILEQIATEILTSEAKTASTVAEAAGISVQKASALLRQLVESGSATVTEVKIPKKGVQKAYAAVDAAADAE